MSDLNQYEIAVLYHPDLEVDLSKAEDRVKKIVTDNGGKVAATDNWGKRKLAYEIAGQSEGLYSVVTFTAEPATLTEVERVLRITDGVMRFQTVRLKD